MTTNKQKYDYVVKVLTEYESKVRLLDSSRYPKRIPFVPGLCYTFSEVCRFFTEIGRTDSLESANLYNWIARKLVEFYVKSEYAGYMFLDTNEKIPNNHPKHYRTSYFYFDRTDSEIRIEFLNQLINELKL